MKMADSAALRHYSVNNIRHRIQAQACQSRRATLPGRGLVIQLSAFTRPRPGNGHSCNGNGVISRDLACVFAFKAKHGVHRRSDNKGSNKCIAFAFSLNKGMIFAK